MLAGVGLGEEAKCVQVVALALQEKRTGQRIDPVTSKEERVRVVEGQAGGLRLAFLFSERL
jgi:hypothetical protein